MSFLRSPIAVDPEWPSVLTGIFSYQSHCFLCVYFLFLSLVTTTLSSGADWWIIDKPPVF